jgi:hypothetical protein
MRADRSIALLSLCASAGACASILGLDSGIPLGDSSPLDAGPDAPSTRALDDGSVALTNASSLDAGAVDVGVDTFVPGDTSSDATLAADTAGATDATSAPDTTCIPESLSKACGAKQCGTTTNNCGDTVSCGDDGGTSCASPALCASDLTCCTQPASCSSATGCCPGTYCWAGEELNDPGTCEATACPAQYAPCVAVGDCCYGYVCQGNEQSGYFCQ